jgi:hypothetical protein
VTTADTYTDTPSPDELATAVDRFSFSGKPAGISGAP